MQRGYVDERSDIGIEDYGTSLKIHPRGGESQRTDSVSPEE